MFRFPRLTVSRVNSQLSHITPAREKTVVRWLVIFGIWTLLAVLMAAQSALSLLHAGMPVAWERLLTDRLLDWYTCALFTPAYVWMVRRYPVDRQHWQVALPLLLAVTSVFVVLKYMLYNELRFALVEGAAERTLTATLARMFIAESIAFWAVIAAVHAAEFYRRVREREKQEAELRVQLAEARLDALAAQLHPHFLFNTLHGISALMHRDVEAADTMLAQLSELLRRTLESSERREVAMREELDLLERYLSIVRVRFGDRLTVRVRIEVGADRGLVPHFLLQPLVENALQHGIGTRAGNATIDISAVRVDDMLEIRVVDDGCGIAPNGEAEELTEGVGLSNSRRRLATLYGRNQSLTLSNAPGRGLCVTVTLPFRLAPETEGHEGGAVRRRYLESSSAVTPPAHV